MPRPRTSAGTVSTEERILAAAETEFARVGFGRARLEDIARAAGIRRPSLLYHYPTKAALYAQVVHRAFASLDAVLTASLAAAGDYRERLDATVSAWLGFLGARPSFAPLVLREIVDGRGPGRGLLLEGLPPILERVERFVGAEPARRRDLPIRAALVQVATASLVAAASPALHTALTGPDDPTPLLARFLFMEDR